MNPFAATQRPATCLGTDTPLNLPACSADVSRVKVRLLVVALALSSAALLAGCGQQTQTTVSCSQSPFPNSAQCTRTETTHDAGNTVTDWAKDHTGYVVVGGFFGVAAVAEEINKRQKNKKV